MREGLAFVTMPDKSVLCILEVSKEEKNRRRIAAALGWIIECVGISLLLLGSTRLQGRGPDPLSSFAILTLSFRVEPRTLVKLTPLRKVAAGRSKSPPILPAHALPPQPLEAAMTEKSIALPTQAAKSPITLTELPAAVSTPLPLPASHAAPAVHTGVWEQNSAGVRIALRAVQTGSFDNPQEPPSRLPGGNQGNVLLLGGFDLPERSSQANGTGEYEESARGVKSAGFGGEGQASPSPFPAAPVAVMTGAFEGASDPKPLPVKLPAAASPLPATRPVEILFKPSPLYTEEARRLRVQGEVVLSVVFQADGVLRVVGVLKSLGHGLDQMAAQAASQIRFKPAEWAGKPTDCPASLRIEFRLA